MWKNRMVYIVITVSLLVLASLLVYQTAAVAKAVTGAPSCSFSQAQIGSIHGEYVAGINKILPFIGDRPTGVEGGLLDLRNCAALGK